MTPFNLGVRESLISSLRLCNLLRINPRKLNSTPPVFTQRSGTALGPCGTRGTAVSSHIFDSQCPVECLRVRSALFRLLRRGLLNVLQKIVDQTRLQPRDSGFWTSIILNLGISLIRRTFFPGLVSLLS